nr:hypothetical protein [Nitrosomonas nitrosa]
MRGKPPTVLGDVREVAAALFAMGDPVMPYYRHRSPIGVHALACRRAETTGSCGNVDHFIHPRLSIETASAVILLQS